MPIQRSRGGCHNCKRRKRKCDETRPQCRACQSRGDSCGGYNIQLKWNASRVSPSQRSNASESPASKTKELSGHSPAGSASTVSTQDSPSEMMQIPSRGSATAVEREAFERFIKSGVHALYATTVNEWIKPLIGQYAQQSLALLVVCANIQILIEDGPSVKFHSHFERVLDIFRGELFASSGELNSATLGAGLLLCTLSILQGQEWTNNLQCMADFYNLRSDMRGLQTPPDRYARHCLEVMGVMDLPNLVLGRRTDCLGFWQQLRQAQKQWPDTAVDGVEPISGIPRTLLDICTRIQDPNAEIQFWLWHGQVGELIQCQLWEAFRFAGMLDHRRRWRQKSQVPASPPPGVSLPASKELLFRLLSALEALWQGLKQKENEHVLVANATLYPWFVASLEVKLLWENPHWKDALDRFHSNFHASDPSRNIKIAEEIVAEAQQDLSESFDIEWIARQRPVEIALF